MFYRTRVTWDDVKASDEKNLRIRLGAHNQEMDEPQHVDVGVEKIIFFKSYCKYSLFEVLMILYKV